MRCPCDEDKGAINGGGGIGGGRGQEGNGLIVFAEFGKYARSGKGIVNVGFVLFVESQELLRGGRRFLYTLFLFPEGERLGLGVVVGVRG